MNNIKKYNILYYLCFIITLIGIVLFNIMISDMGVSFNYILIFINLILFILFVILNRKFKLKKVNIWRPNIYIILFLIVIGLCFIINNLVMVEYIHFMYYFNFILIGYIMFNIYSLLCLSK